MPQEPCPVSAVIVHCSQVRRAHGLASPQAQVAPVVCAWPYAVPHTPPSPGVSWVGTSWPSSLWPCNTHEDHLGCRKTAGCTMEGQAGSPRDPLTGGSCASKHRSSGPFPPHVDPLVPLPRSLMETGGSGALPPPVVGPPVPLPSPGALDLVQDQSLLPSSGAQTHCREGCSRMETRTPPLL